VWLDGLLFGASSTPDAQDERRQGLAFDDAPVENSAGDAEDLPAERPEPIEGPLSQCRRRIRERRELAGMPPLEIAEGERNRRSAQIVASFLKDHSGGREPTPLHLILGARYIEGEMDFERYSSAVRKV